MGDLKEMLGRVVEARRLAGMNPDDYPRNTRAGFQMAANQARAELVGLERAYLTELQRRSVTVFVLGAPADVKAFVGLAGRAGVAVCCDASDTYRRIAQKVDRSIGPDRNWTAHQHALAVENALSEAVDLGFQDANIDNRRSFQPRSVQTLEAVVEAVRETIVDRLGHDIARCALRKAIAQQAVEKGLADGPVGVLLHGARTEDEARELLGAWTSASSVVTLEDRPTAKLVKECFVKTKNATEESDEGQGTP